MKKCLSMMLVFVLILALLPIGAQAADFTIKNYEELLLFAQSVNIGTNYSGQTIELAANIDLGGNTNPWTSIGTSSNKFKGTFDGKNHVISGLYINATASNQGFFGYVNGGTIKNLTVIGNITTSAGNAGGIAAQNESGSLIENCHNGVNITITANFTNYFGGITSVNNGTINNCYNSGNISASASSAAVGGIVGQNTNNGAINNCYNIGNINNGTGSHVGGIAGQQRFGAPSVTNSYNTGSISGGSNIGGVMGQWYVGSVTNNYYLTGTASSGVASGTATAVEKSADEMKDADFVTTLGGAYTLNDGYPIFSWQTSVKTETPVSPLFIETNEYSKTIAEYIKAAINAKKTKAGLLPTDSLLSNYKSSSTDTDWIAVAMGGYSLTDENGDISYLYPDGSGYEDYLAALEEYITDTYAENGGILHDSKATEWQRVILAIHALGGDPTNFGTYNGDPIDLVADGTYNNNTKGQGPGWQGINGLIFGLIALDTNNYEIPDGAKYTRERFITEILKAQATGGVNGNRYAGWSLGSNSTDPDIAAMAIQALAPYYFTDTEYTYINSYTGETLTKTVRTAINEALDKLGALQSDNGGFSSWGTGNIESVAQVITALCSIGTDLRYDSRFIKKGKTLLDAILLYRSSEGGFGHVDTTFNSMATDQASYALAAYWRYLNNMHALYDYRKAPTALEKTKIETAKTSIDNLPSPMNTGYKAAIKSALSDFRAVESVERRYVYNYYKLANALDSVGGEAELDNNNPYIVNIEITTPPVKLSYIEDDYFDTDGMIVTANYSDNSSIVIDDYTVLPSGKLALSDTTISIIKGTCIVTVEITITEKPLWLGTGNENDPYIISDLQGFLNLQDYLNIKNKPTEGLYFQMDADVDLTEIDNWTPIGTSARYFRGNFDGNGYMIENLNSMRGGLFGYVSDSVVIKNLGIKNGSLGNGNTSFVGAIAGWSDGADFINCWSGVSIGGNYSGGIVGTIRGGIGSVIDCYNVGTISGETIGGIVGHIQTGDANFKVIVDSCYNKGVINAGDTGYVVAGGIAGTIQGGGHIIRNCYNIGKVSEITANNPRIGCIIGQQTSGSTVDNSYYLQNSEGVVIGIGNGDGGTTIKTEAELKSVGMFLLLGSSFKADLTPNINNGYPILTWEKQPVLKSSDTSLSSVMLGEYEAIFGENNIYTVSVPDGKESAFVTITTTDVKAKTTDPYANNDYTQWTFSVTAEDGTIANYVINVVILANIALIPSVTIYEPWIAENVANFEITASSNISYKVLAAGYKGGKLIDLTEKTLSVEVGTDIYEMDFSNIAATEYDTLRLFIWDGYNNFIPITKSVDFIR